MVMKRTCDNYDFSIDSCIIVTEHTALCPIIDQEVCWHGYSGNSTHRIGSNIGTHFTT